MFPTYLLLPLKHNSQICCKFGDILHYIVYKDRYHVIEVIYPDLPPTMFNGSKIVLFCVYVIITITIVTIIIIIIIIQPALGPAR